MDVWLKANGNKNNMNTQIFFFDKMKKKEMNEFQMKQRKKDGIKKAQSE